MRAQCGESLYREYFSVLSPGGRAGLHAAKDHLFPHLCRCFLTGFVFLDICSPGTNPWQ